MNKKYLSAIISTVAIVAFLIVLYIFNVTLDYAKPGDILTGNIYETAQVIQINSDTIQPDPVFPYVKIGRQELVLEIISGKNSGKIVTAKNFVERMINAPAKIGTKMVISSYDDFITTSIVDYNREPIIYGLMALFILIVIFIGGKKGLKSLFSLAFTLICIIFLFIPLIIKGVNPILASVLVAILSTLATLLSLNGWCKKTIAAGVSCVLCTFLAGIIAFISGMISHISTMNTPEAEDLLYISQNTNLHIKYLLFAGILFASLGAIMDTSMSISSAIFEMKEINNALTQKQLFKSGMNIGKDVMGTMTNTLILAFTGSSINIFIMFYMYQMPYVQLVNMQLLVVEVIQGLSGSIAVIFSIPITAIIATKMIEKYK